MTVEITIDATELDMVRSELAGIPGAQERAVKTALRKSRRNLDTRVRRQLASYYGIRTKALKGRVFQGKRDDYRIWVGFDPLDITKYFPKSRYRNYRRGLRVGKPKIYVPGAFRVDTLRGGTFAARRLTKRSYPIVPATLDLERAQVRRLLEAALIETQPLVVENFEKAIQSEIAKATR